MEKKTKLKNKKICLVALLKYKNKHLIHTNMNKSYDII